MRYLILTLLIASNSYAVTDYNFNGVTTAVKQDTVTPANSRPLPTQYLNLLGVRTNLATEASLQTLTSTVGSAGSAIAAPGIRVLGSDGTLNRSLLTDTLGRLTVAVASSALPAGAATEAKQDTEIAALGTLNAKDFATQTTLAALNGKFGSLGQKTMAGSAPVVIASDQSSLPVTVGNFPATQPVSGTVTVTQATGTNLHAVIDSGTVAATQSGTWNITNISGTVSLPTGAATSALQTSGNASLTSIDGKVATETTLAAMSAKLPATLGQKTSANSMAVVLSSDQSAIATKAPVNTNGSQANTALTATTASTATVPANAVGFIIQAPDSNTDSIRYRVGGTASTTAGMQLQPGRDSGYIPVAANVSVCATVSGTNAFEIQWILSQ